MKTNILFLLLFILSLGVSKAQDYEQMPIYRHKTWITGVPQHLFQSGLRLEIDKKIGGPGSWIIFAPTLYYRNQPSEQWFNDYDVLSVKGAGLDVYYRWYLRHEKEDAGFYLSTGGGYRNVNREMEGYTWVSYRENDLDLIRHEDMIVNKTTQTLSLRLTAGLQKLIHEHMALDFFMGIGIKYSFENSPNNDEYSYDNNIYSFGGTGFIFIGGVRAGVGW